MGVCITGHAAERIVPRDCVVRNRGADFVIVRYSPRSARRNMALDFDVTRMLKLGGDTKLRDLIY